MKPQNRFLLALGLILFISGVALYPFFLQHHLPTQTHPATIRHDCAPWDGSAFTVQIPWQNGAVIHISIWQSPKIDFPKAFCLPDDTGDVGNAILIHPIGQPEPLTGIVYFPHVDTSSSVEGRFDLKDESGHGFSGLFNAVWQEQKVQCG
jgi:hypothetical protein